MKLKRIIFQTFLFVGFIMSCSTDDNAVDNRELVRFPIYPNQQIDELNSAFIISGELRSGSLPEALNAGQVQITTSVPSASITNDNFLFLPFGFDVNNTIQGIYLQAEGASNYWDVPVELTNPGDTSYALAIGIPANVQEGEFVLSYRIYDDQNNVSELRSVNTSIVGSQIGCNGGQGIPRVEGQDGITVKTFDFGDVAGTVNVSYFMYTLKDRMDIRYNNQWFASTSPQLLNEGQAPPSRTCSEASEADGFVSGGGTFSIPYDPSISRTMSIYVSGCLESGTLWYFDIVCPDGSSGGIASICGNSTIQDQYDPTDPNYHIYPEEGDELMTVICDPNENPNCTVASVYNAMLSSSVFIAPTFDIEPVVECKKTWVIIPSLNIWNPVVTTVNSSNYSIINYTVADETSPFGTDATHKLHPGKVTRTVKLVDGKVVVCTEGEGVGPWATLNVFFSGTVWSIVDLKLKAFWNLTN